MKYKLETTSRYVHKGMPPRQNVQVDVYKKDLRYLKDHQIPVKTAVRDALEIYVRERKSRTIPLDMTKAERDAWILFGSDNNKHENPIKRKALRVHPDRDRNLKSGMHLGTAAAVPGFSPELLAPILRTSTRAEQNAWLVSAEKAELDAWVLDGTVPARVTMTNRTAARS